MSEDNFLVENCTFLLETKDGTTYSVDYDTFSSVLDQEDHVLSFDTDRSWFDHSTKGGDGYLSGTRFIPVGKSITLEDEDGSEVESNTHFINVDEIISIKVFAPK